MKGAPAESRIGSKLNRWTITGIDRRPEHRANGKTWMVPYALCVCECGSTSTVILSSIVKGTSKSCGCLAREITSAAKTKHGMGGTLIYRTWASMVQRCTNPNQAAAPRYCNRGIYVSARWLRFENFFADMSLPPTPKHSIDRIDNDGPYAWWNCRWATSREQGANMSTNRWITFGDRKLILTEWARQLGVSPGNLHWMMARYGEQAAIARLAS